MGHSDHMSSALCLAILYNSDITYIDVISLQSKRLCVVQKHVGLINFSTAIEKLYLFSIKNKKYCCLQPFLFLQYLFFTVVKPSLESFAKKLWSDSQNYMLKTIMGWKHPSNDPHYGKPWNVYILSSVTVCILCKFKLNLLAN